MSTNNLLVSDGLPTVPPTVWLGFAFCVFLVSVIFIAILKKTATAENKRSALKTVLIFLEHALKNPMLLFLGGYAIYAASYVALKYFPHLPTEVAAIISSTSSYIAKVAEFVSLFWAIINILNEGQIHLQTWLMRNNKKISVILLPMVSKSLKAAVLLLMLNILIPALGFSGQISIVIAKAAKVALIAIIAWLVIEIINGIEKLILNQYSYNEDNPLLSRRVNTQVLLIKKVIMVIVFIVTIASMLMVFDSVKNLGTGLLTTAGLLSAVGAFASQQSLGRIFAGLQIAFTQPIRIGDTVIIDAEQGQVEEITLSYIVVKLWDLRRMIVPSDYFTNRGLQNLSRYSPELLGTVFFYTDYTLPMEPVRQEFDKILKNSTLWNGQVSGLQVSDLKESAMEIRALVSAKDAATLWNLRCEIREKLMRFIIENYPDCLSKRRNITTKSE